MLCWAWMGSAGSRIPFYARVGIHPTCFSGMGSEIGTLFLRFPQRKTKKTPRRKKVEKSDFEIYPARWIRENVG